MTTLYRVIVEHLRSDLQVGKVDVIGPYVDIDIAKALQKTIDSEYRYVNTRIETLTGVWEFE